MSMSYGKRAVSRAGAHLAARQVELRDGERTALVDSTDPVDLQAKLIVEWWRAQHIAPMLSVHATVSQLSPDLEIRDARALRAVSFRPKRFETMIEKLTREPGKLADMADIGGVRAVLNTQNQVDELCETLADALDVRRIRDWARHPRPTGYRATHLHARQDGRIIEVQLRTFGQDAWANLVEEEGRMSGVNYKAGDGSPIVLDFFRTVAHMFAVMELGESHPAVADRLRDAYVDAERLLVSPTLRGLHP